MPTAIRRGHATAASGSDAEPALFALLRKARQAVLDSPQSMDVNGAGEEFAPSVCLDGVLPALDSLLPEHLGVSPKDVARVTCRSGLGYQEVYAGQEMTMCVFVLRRGAKIPLHDHPGMHVYGRLLFGQLRVRSYDPSEPDPWSWRSERTAVLRSDCTVGPAPTTYSLGPEQGNIHELQALEDSAFFDVLTPSYDPHDGRDCSYFSREGPEDAEKVVLVPTEQWGFYMDSLKYRGPPFLRERFDGSGYVHGEA